MTERAVLVDIVRSPFGKGRETGALHGIHPVDLVAELITRLLERNGVAGRLVEDVILGTTNPIAEQGGNIARHAALAAGLPVTVPGVQIDRKCGSAQQAIDFAASGIAWGTYELVVAGGVELMSVVPVRANRMGKDSLGGRFRARYPDGLPHQGISAEIIAARHGLSREELDAYALRSHERAASFVDPFLVPIDVPTGDGSTRRVAADEGIRRDTSLAKLAKLAPAFREHPSGVHYPEIAWRITAGNSSQITDGGAVALLASERVAKDLGLRRRARVTKSVVIGDDPITALLGVVPATKKLLARAGIAIEDVGRFEVNEAFASVVLAWCRETAAPLERVNVHGGAIAYGHPVGASGVRLMGSLVAALESSGQRWGIQVMCEAAGMANATLIERLDDA